MPLIESVRVKSAISLKRVPMPKHLTIAQAQEQLPTLSTSLTQEPVVITQDGIPVMAALSYTYLTELLETMEILADSEFVGQLRESIGQAAQGKTVNWEVAKAQLGLSSMNAMANDPEIQAEIAAIGQEFAVADLRHEFI
jgi:antitoxin YefM